MSQGRRPVAATFSRALPTAAALALSGFFGSASDACAQQHPDAGVHPTPVPPPQPPPPGGIRPVHPMPPTPPAPPPVTTRNHRKPPEHPIAIPGGLGRVGPLPRRG